MDKLIERLLTMADDGATADEVTRLFATDGTALLHELMQGYVDRCAEREGRVEVPRLAAAFERIPPGRATNSIGVADS